MSLVRRNNLFFPSLVNELIKPDWFGGMERFESTIPAVNIKETDSNFELELAIPGRKKEDFNIEIDEDVLTISMEDKSEKEVTESNYTRKEFSYKSFRRAFNLPDTVNDDKIEATYIDGILRFTLPKKEEALPKAKRTIDVGQ